MSFSIPTFLTGVSAVLSKSADAALAEALMPATPADVSGEAIVAAMAGRTVGIQANTTAATWVSQGPIGGAEGVTIREFDGHGAGMAAMADGSIDAYFADKTILQGLLQTEGLGDVLQVSPATFTHEPYALAIRHGDEEMRLLVDRALSFLYRSGELAKIYERTFGSMPPEARLFYHSVALPE